MHELTSIDSGVAGSGIGDGSETSRIAACQVGSVGKTKVLDSGIEVSFELLRAPA